jgi:hypothetical protein
MAHLASGLESALKRGLALRERETMEEFLNRERELREMQLIGERWRPGRRDRTLEATHGVRPFAMSAPLHA